MVLSLKLLGEFSVCDAAGAKLALPTRKTRALLGFLAVNVGKPQPRERLMALLWSNRSERQARQSLNQALSSIRGLGTPEGLALLDSDDQSVTLRSGAVEIDIQRFRRLLEDDPAQAATLYGGPFLDGFAAPDPTFEEWLGETRSTLHTAVCDALERLADTAVARDETERAIQDLKRLLVLDPLREGAHRTLMRLLHQSGDRAAALRQYQACVKILKNELQVGPDTATISLFQQIRQGTSNRKSSTQKDRQHDSLQQLQGRPSIAVLPFEDLSRENDQTFLADGMAEDIITALSKFRWFFVIARNSSFAYRNRPVNVTQIADELGVRYVLEGSVRKVGERVRITAQLIDAESGNHMWAERFDRQVKEIFKVQDRITDAIVAAIAPEIEQAEIARARRKAPDNLDAWALYHRGLALYPSGRERDFRQAIDLFDQARLADPNFVDAIAMAALMRTRLAYLFEPDNYDGLLVDATQLLQTSMRLDPRNFICHMALSRLHYTNGEYDLAVDMGQKAVALNPNSVTAHIQLGIALFGANRYEESLRHKDIALRLSPNDPQIWGIFSARASPLFMLGRYQECADSAYRAATGPYPRHWADSLAVAALIKLGRREQAELAKRRLLEQKPDFSVSKIEKFYLTAHPPELVRSYCDALRESGLPE